MAATGVVFRKEVLDNLRDRRSLMAALFYPLLGPAILVLLLAVVGKSFSEQQERPLDLPVSGAERAPSLMSFLEQNGAVIAEAPEDPEAAVRAGDVDVVLIIPEGYGEAFEAGRPAPVRLVIDDTRQAAAVSIRRAERLLSSYSRTIGSQRLMVRGVSPTIISALAVETESVATEQSQAAQLLSMAPYFIIFSIFIGGIYLAIDSTAGERERGSLEPLLTTPAARWQLVLGKYGATVLFTVVAVIETLLAFYLVLNYVPLEDFLGIRVSLGVGAVAGIFLLTIPMVFLAAALQLLIATFTKSFKEAQNYLSLLPLVPALPGMFIALIPFKVKLWMMMIPTFGQQILINQLMRGEEVEIPQVAISAVITLVLAVVLVVAAMRLWERERILFGR